MRNILERFRLIKSETDDMEKTALVQRETHTMYFEVAKIVCQPGDQKSKMDEAVRQALGGYSLWRTKACRLNQAGCFSAAAVFDLQARYRAFLALQAAKADSAKRTEAARQLASDRTTIQRCLAQHRAEIAKLEARLAHLEEAGLA